MIKKSFIIAVHKFNDWILNPRYWVLFFVLFAIIFHDFSPLINMCASVQVRTNPMMFPFWTSNYYNQFLFVVGIVFLFADAPFMNENQPYAIIRSGKRVWAFGQIIYIILAATIYVFVLMAFSVLILLPKGTFATNGWGSIVTTLSLTNATESIGLGFNISGTLMNNFTPVQAFLFCFFMESCVAAVIGLLMFSINFFTAGKSGLFVAMLIALFDLLIVNSMPLSFYAYSPVSLGRIDGLTIAEYSYLPTVKHAFIYLICWVVILSVIILVFADKPDIKIRPNI